MVCCLRIGEYREKGEAFPCFGEFGRAMAVSPAAIFGLCRLRTQLSQLLLKGLGSQIQVARP